MDNKICAKPMYKCAVCGEVYDSIEQRMNCEQTCLKKKAEEERKAAELKREAEYAVRKEEVDAAFDHAFELRDKLVRDYGSYVYHKATVNNSDLYFPFKWLWE